MINFDILYKKKLETDSIKLLGESQLRQLKLMICGKYQIYDFSHLFIYYKNNKITSNDSTKLKEIFKTKKAKIEITEKEKVNNNEFQNLNFRNLCKCGNPTTYICEKCEEFLCDFCLKKKKHITHDKNIIKLSDYPSYIKKNLNDLASELDSKILNDEAYKFLKYWEYDKDKEIKTINNLYDFIKEQIEDIKQLQIDYIINLSEGNKYNELKLKIQNALNDYSSFNLDEEEIEKIIEQKKILLQNSQNVLSFYNEIKIELLKYTKTIKELQWFNQEFQKFIQNKFNITKKKYSNFYTNLNSSLSYNNFNTIINNENNNDNNDNVNINYNSKGLSSNSSMGNLKSNLDYNSLLINVKTINKLPKNNKSKSKIQNNSKKKSSNSVTFSPKVEKEKSQEDNNNKEFEQLSKNLLNTSLNNNKNNRYNTINSSPCLNNSQSHLNYNSLNFYASGKSGNILLKLKDTRNILIFNINTQIFTEKIYYDKGNFRKELTSEADVTQLNLLNNLFMLSGKQSNKFYYYNFSLNSVIYINSCIFSHFYGVMLYSKKNNVIYLLGGNSQKHCEMYSLPTSNSTDKKISHKWRVIPPLNEERQEFAAMIYNDDNLYVFFGFSHIKGINLSSIERMNINTHEKFEIVYINEQITLSSIGCSFFDGENEDGSGGILLLGGFDGEKYIENTLIFSPEQMKIRECDIIIPNISKHFQFLFHLESNFIQMDNNLQVVFDMKNNVHILTSHSYELFSEV